MIRKVSIPMVVGMIVAAVVGPSTYLAEASLVLASSILIYLFLHKSRSPALFCLLFFSTGLLCRTSYSLIQAPARELPWSSGWLKALVDRVPFGRAGTSGLIKALLTGDRSGLGHETIKAFRTSGASHILALSGLHLGIIYLLVTRTLSILGNSPAARIVRYVLTISLSGAYALMTGASPSIIRAFLFILLNETADLHPDRQRDSISVFWTAITIQLVCNPSVLESAGFQLSYLAILGIFLIYPKLRDCYPQSGKMDIFRAIWDTAALSISCQIFTAPLAYHLFGTFPKYFLLANLIALPLTEVLITGGLACVFLSPSGLCPKFLTGLVDTATLGLEKSLEIISEM